MRANMHSPEIEVDPKTGKTVAEILGVSYDHQPTATELFAKREDVGAILAKHFNDTEDLAKQNGIRVHCIEDEVINIERTGINYAVTLKSDRTLKADYIILALGHIPPTSYPHLFGCINYIRNPWAQDSQISNISPDAKVAVIGLGPTAVDTIIKLRDGGVNRVIGYSRSGAMQYPRPIPAEFIPRIVTEENIVRIAGINGGSLRFDILVGMLAAEFISQGVDWSPLLAAVEVSKHPPLEALRRGYANSNKTSDWFGLAASLTVSIPAAWHLLDDAGRERFLRMKSRVSNVLYGMAPSHALRMLTELENRSLEVLGGLTAVAYDESSRRFQLKRQNGDQETVELMDYIIDCTGFGTNLELADTELIKNLLASNYLRCHAHGGAIVDFDSGQLARIKGGRAVQIYCLSGTLNIGTRLVTNGLGEVARSAHRTARAIHSRLDDMGHGVSGSSTVMR
jgi:uncharacterized NAD(P)/FAD-binding protein YdhS